MVTIQVAIVLVDKVLKVVEVSAMNRSDAVEIVFAYADQRYGANPSFELALLDEPRMQVLFEKELAAIDWRYYEIEKINIKSIDQEYKSYQESQWNTEWRGN